MNKINCFRNHCNEVCRMPWFLVEVKSKEATSRGQTEHFIVHSVDINEAQSSYMYVNGLVQFDHNQSSIEGNVILASEDRSFVEQEMQRITVNAAGDKMEGRLFFIQYSPNSRELVQKVVAEADIDWPVDTQRHPDEVFIKVAQNQFRARVLMASELESRVEAGFEKLRNWTLLKYLDKSHSRKANEVASTDNWILVQYCKASLEVVYAILKERETHWTEQNRYKDIVSYVNDGDTVFQALVLAKSASLESLIFEINSIRESAAVDLKNQMETSEKNNFKHPSASSFYQQYVENVMSTRT